MHLRLPSLRACRYIAERRAITRIRLGLAAAANRAYGIQSKPISPSVCRMPLTPGITVLKLPVVEVLLTNYEPK